MNKSTCGAVNWAFMLCVMGSLVWPVSASAAGLNDFQKDEACRVKGSKGASEVLPVARQYFARRGFLIFDSAFDVSGIITITLTPEELFDYNAQVFKADVGEQAEVPPPGTKSIKLKSGRVVPAITKSSLLVLAKGKMPTNNRLCDHEYVHAALFKANIPSAMHHEFIINALRWGESTTNFAENLNGWTRLPACQSGATTNTFVECARPGEACSEAGDFTFPIQFPCNVGKSLKCIKRKCVTKGSTGPAPKISSSCNKNVSSGTTHFWSFNEMKQDGEYTIFCNNGFSDTMTQPLDAQRTDGKNFKQDGWFYHGWSSTLQARSVVTCTSKFVNAEGVVFVGSPVTCK